MLGELEATAAYREDVKNLEDSWAPEVDGETLRFRADPGLVSGDVFLLQGTAYKVAASQTSANETVVTVTEPALDELFSSLVISGRAELGAANFSLNPAIAAASVDSNKDNSGPNVGWALQASNYIIDGWKTAKITGATRTIDDGASVRGAFHVGGRFETEAAGWDPVFDRGSASLAVMMAPDLLLYLEKGANYPASDDICTSEGFGGGQGRIRIGTLSVPTNLPLVRIDIPFCASIVGEVSGSLEVLKLSGKIETGLDLQGSRAPMLRRPSGQLMASAPGSDAARIPDGPYLASAQPSTLKRVAVSGTFALEQSLELKAHGRVRYGAAGAVKSVFDYSGSAAHAAVDRHFDVEARSPSPEVCISVETATSFVGAGYEWERSNLEVVTLRGAVPSSATERTSRHYGTCACEDGEETAACTGGGDLPVARDVSVEGAADSAITGQLDATDAETFAIVSMPSHGSVDLDSTTGAFTYVPSAGYAGSDSFSYRARNAAGDSTPALVSIVIVAAGPKVTRIKTYKNRNTFAAPGSSHFSAVTQPFNGTLVQSNVGRWLYKPNPDFVGEDSYSFYGDAPEIVMVVVTVAPTCETGVVTLTDDRNTFSRRIDSSGTLVGVGIARVEGKHDWEHSPDHCQYEVTAVNSDPAGADPWIVLPERPTQNKTYEVSSSVGSDKAYVGFSNWSTDYDTGGAVSVSVEGEQLIITATDLPMSVLSGNPNTATFTIVSR